MKLILAIFLCLPVFAAERVVLAMQQDQRYFPNGGRIPVRVIFRNWFEFPPVGGCTGVVSMSLNGRIVGQRNVTSGVDADFSFTSQTNGWQEMLFEYHDPSGACGPARVFDVAHTGVLGPPYCRVWPSNNTVRFGEYALVAGILPPNAPAALPGFTLAVQLMNIEFFAHPTTLPYPPFYKFEIYGSCLVDCDLHPLISLVYGSVADPIFTLANPEIRFLRDGIMRLETVTGQTSTVNSTGLELSITFDSYPTAKQIERTEITWYDGTTVLARLPASNQPQFFKLPALAAGRHALRAEIRGLVRTFSVQSNIFNLDVTPARPRHSFRHRRTTLGFSHRHRSRDTRSPSRKRWQTCHWWRSRILAQRVS